VANKWETFAQEDASHYIATQLDDDFGESGVRTATRILSEAQVTLHEGMNILEFGCGTGRVLLPIAAGVRRAFGVDVSPTMLEHLAEAAEARGVSNVVGLRTTDDWPTGIDFAYSNLVFQHIESTREIEGALRGIHACLRDTGVAHLQFDTRHRSLAYRARFLLPDRLLRRDWRRGIRRIRRPADRVRSLLRITGLQVIREYRHDSADHVFVVRNEQQSRVS
jgi:cyclopropane fatty-acyl-phospholipid synthase-like methyltransferase